MKFRSLANEQPATSPEAMAASQAADVRSRATLNFNKLGLQRARLLSHMQLQVLITLLSAPQIMPAQRACSLFSDITDLQLTDPQVVQQKLASLLRYPRGSAAAAAASAAQGDSDVGVTARIMAAVRALQGPDEAPLPLVAHADEDAGAPADVPATKLSTQMSSKRALLS